MEKASSRREVQSVKRALTVLECVIFHPGGISLADISREVSLNRNTVFQLLNTLCSSGYLLQDHTSRDYFPSTRLRWLCSANDIYIRLRHLAQPVLAGLVQETRETAHLAVLDEGPYVRFLEKVEAPQPLVVLTDLEVPMPLQITSVGKAILANLPPAKQDSLLEQIQFTSHTKNTLTSTDDLQRDLSFVRSSGYAKDDEEHFEAVRCVAAAVLDRDGGPVCAIGISAPKIRMPDFEKAAEPVIKAAQQLQQILFP